MIEHVKIPDWFEVSRKKDRGDPLDDLELFILNNEPADAERFLAELQDVLDFIYTEGMVDGLNSDWDKKEGE